MGLSRMTVVLLALAGLSVLTPAYGAGPDKPLNLDANGRVIKKHCTRGEAKAKSAVVTATPVQGRAAKPATQTAVTAYAKKGVKNSFASATVSGK